MIQNVNQSFENYTKTCLINKEMKYNRVLVCMVKEKRNVCQPLQFVIDALPHAAHLTFPVMEEKI